MRAWAAAVMAVQIATSAMADRSVTLLDFADLSGWADDDHDAALDVFTQTCGDMRPHEWQVLCALAKSGPPARGFFEAFFRPVLIEDGQPMRFTGYFEPELPGARAPDDRFRYPIYAVPPDLPEAGPWHTRQQIDEGILDDQGLELAWLDNPVDLFFLQVQGSGRIRLPDGGLMRVGYGAANRHDYTSIGQTLIARGALAPHQASARAIRNWVAANPDDAAELLWTNASYVFFREVSEVPADRGPLGAMNRSITTMRTVAVDPSIVLLGAPVWIEKDGAAPLNRLMIAQDTGSAITGAQRADIFFGTGPEAGEFAGTINDAGRMVVLMPIQSAYALLPDTVGTAD